MSEPLLRVEDLRTVFRTDDGEVQAVNGVSFEVGEKETLLDAAKKLADRGFGAMPICGEDNRLKGMLTDRDIVVKVLAEGRDPAGTKAGELGEGKPVTIGADDSIQEALKTMARYKVRRLPVIDGHDLVGIVSLKDIVENLPDPKAGDLVQAIVQGG